jgi:hypothetical protein
LADPAFLAASMALTALAQPHLFAAETLVSLDTATQYYPWYAFLGQSLRAGHIAGWNPATFSGTPFAANPLSGWTYVPAMLIFAVLPIATAIRVYLIAQPALAAIGAYALARTLGLNRAGALVASFAYANASFLQVQNIRSSPFASVYGWLPFALLGAEVAVRTRRWPARFAGWAIAAFAMSQIVAVWPGQGAYYAGLLVGGYIAFRTVFTNHVSESADLLRRVVNLLLHGGAVFVFAAALDAAAILPRLEFNELSNLAGGYTGAEAAVGGLNPRDRPDAAALASIPRAARLRAIAPPRPGADPDCRLSRTGAVGGLGCDQSDPQRLDLSSHACQHSRRLSGHRGCRGRPGNWRRQGTRRSDVA